MSEHAPRAQSSLTDSPAAPRRRLGVAALSVAATIGVGVLIGQSVFTFGYGKGGSYFVDDPASCINCHIMQPQYESWLKSSHQRVATCNDCHLPPDALDKLVTKADNGFFHSLAFTMGRFDEPIRIKPRNRRATQRACLHCHSQVADPLRPAHAGGDMLLCVQCHQDVGHAHR